MLRTVKDSRGCALLATDGVIGIESTAQLESTRDQGAPSGGGARNEGRRAMINLKRAYDAVSRTDGTRFLVERLWPRGLSKPTLQLDAWLKGVGPSTALRRWFSHDPEKWREFRRRYFRELDSRPEAWQPITAAARRGTVTLVYSSHDTEHNNAVALKEYVQAKSRRSAKSSRASAAPRRSAR